MIKYRAVIQDDLHVCCSLPWQETNLIAEMQCLRAGLHGPTRNVGWSRVCVLVLRW